MSWTERGTVQGGGIILSRPLALPDGTQVQLTIEPVSPAAEPPSDAQPAEPPEDGRLAIGESSEEFARLPIFGMWQDREEMQDPTDWVRAEREKWRQRATRQD